MLCILISNYSIMSGYTIEPLGVGPVPRHNTVPPLGFPPTTYCSEFGTIPAKLQCFQLLTICVKIIQQRPKWLARHYIYTACPGTNAAFHAQIQKGGGQGFQSHMENHMAVGFLHNYTGTDPLEGPIASRGRSLRRCLNVDN